MVKVKEIKLPGLVIWGFVMSLWSVGCYAQPIEQTQQAYKCAITSEPNRVYTANPLVTYLLMALAPEKLVGWNFPPPKQAKGVFADESFNKPVIGGWFGQGRTPNLEVLIRSKPDFMLMSGVNVKTDQQAVLSKLGVPVCSLKLETLDDYPQDIRRLGVWLNRGKRAEMLATDFENRLKKLAKNRQKLTDLGLTKTVYYAESNSGLATECRGSIHSQVIPLAGGVNPHICFNESAKQSRFGQVDVNFEQLLKYNPDAIVTQEAVFYRQIYQNPKWSGLKAVKNKQVYLMPQVPFRWMDRPPSFMRILAAEWLMQKLYPQQEFYDMAVETQTFIQDYFQVEISPEKVQAILDGDIVDERH
ncbi:ABC transporter substrate-binding protein [Thiomicrorhabdus hydrogeniphila]